VNAWSPFLRAGTEKASLEDVAAHALALAERAGSIDHVGIGADFDGIPYGPAGLETPRELPRLADALAAKGLSEGDIEKVFFSNFLRVFREGCG
jgi:membrane dipeptidase